MALNYLSGRVSRFGVGVPGFSTSGDLTLAVSGAVGVETTKPRAEVDTPNISIRGQIVDSSVAIGSIGYFLSQDEFGIRWRASDPANLAFITIYDDGQQVGLGDFGGLNFKAANDTSFVTITSNPGNPEIADINFDIRWLRNDYGFNRAISTSYGPDGTFWSLPGYGTSEAAGITSVGIGTNQPQDDFQVGIGSTGVTLNGEEGKVEAEIVKAKNIEVDGNLTVESLLVRPGIATLTFLEVVEFATIPLEYVGFSSIEEAQITQLNADNILAGLTTLGVGGQDVFVLNDLFVQGGIGTFDGDVFVAGDLSVGGELFVDQLNANNILITGIATVTSGIFTTINSEELIVSGITTLNELQYNVGFGTTSNVTNLFVVDSEIDNAIITNERITGVSTINIADIDNGFIKFGTIDESIIGVATLGVATVFTDFSVGGATTLAGIVTTGTDAYVGEDLYVGGDTFFKQINATNLNVTGIGTIFQGISTNYSISGILTAENIIAGFATITEVNIGGGQIGGIDFPGTGDIEGNDLKFETGYIGILTGDQLSYTIGTISQFSSGLGTINTLRGDQLFYTETSQINNVTFYDDRLEVSQNLNVVGAAITLGDVATDPRVGLTTIAGDAYVGNDLYVGGEQFINQLNATNLSVTGVATIKDQLNIGITSITSGFATDFSVELLDFESATGVAATITTVSGDNLNFVGNSNFISGQTSKFLSVVRSPGGSEFEGTLQAVNILVGEDIGISRDFIVAGVSTLNIADISQETVAISTITDLTVTGIATVAEVDVEDANVDNLYVGFTSTTELLVTGVSTFESAVNIQDTAFIAQEVVGVSSITDLIFNAGVGTQLTAENANVEKLYAGFTSTTDLLVTGITTFEGLVKIDDIVFTDLEVVGVSSVNQLFFNVGVGTELQVDDLTAGIATVGLASISILQATDINAFEADIEELTATIATVGSGSSTDGALFVTGINTFIGFTTFTGDVFVDGNFTVTGIQSVGQLDAAQSQIGILTVFDRIDSQKITDLNQVSIAGSFVASGISTIGLSTFSSDGDLNINRNLTVGGITTFEGVVRVDDTLFVAQEVAGISTVNELFFNVGVGTELQVDNLTAGIATITNLYAGFTSTTDLLVTGITTFDGRVNIDDIVFTDLEVVGVSSVNELFFNVGVGTELTLERLDVGIITANDLTVNGITTFNANVNINADINIDADILMTGIITATTFDILFGRVGVQTVGIQSVGQQNVIGLSSFQSDVDIFGTAGIATANIGIASVGFLTATEGYIGIITGRDAFFETISVGSSDTEPDGTTGITSDFITTNNAYFTGIVTATTGIFTSVSSEELVVTGITTLGFTTIGAASTTESALFVTGLSTFSGISSFFGNISVEGDLNVSGVTSFAQLDASQSRIGILTVFDYLDNLGNLDVSGITTLGVTSITGALVVDSNATITGILDALSDVNITGGLSVTDVTELSSQVQINSDLNVTGVTTTLELDNSRAVIGIATIGTLDATNADISILEASFIDAGVTTSLLSNIGIVTANPALLVTGISTFDGFTTFTKDVLIEGELQVVGLTTFNDLGAKRAQIGILTVSNFMDVADINQDPTSLAQLADVTFLDANGESLGISGLTTTKDLEVVGFATFAQDLKVTGSVEIGANLDVAGITSLGAPGAAGITTIRGDLYIDGDLFVKDDIFKDEIIGKNAFFSGITTVNQLFVNTGVATNFITTSFQAVTGIVTDLTVDTLDVNIGEIDDLLVGDLGVTGITTLGNSSATGFTTALGDLYVGGEFYAANNAVVLGTLLADNIGVANQIKADVGILTTANIENLFVSDQTTTGNLLVSGITTTASLDAIEINVGILTVTASVEVGFATVQNLYVENASDLGSLNVRDSAQFGSTATFLENATFGKSIISDTLIVSGITTTSQLSVLGVATATGLNVSGTANITAILSNTGTFTTLNSTDVIVDNAVRSNVGIITTLQYEVGTGNTLSVANQFNSISQANLTGITTITDLTASVASVNNLEVTGIATITSIDIVDGSVNVGVATVQELNIADIIVQRATRLVTTATTPAALITLDSGTQSAEFSITIQSGTDTQSTKINVAIDGSIKAWNEYSTVFTNTELASFDVVDSAGETVLLGIPASAASTRFTVYSVSHNS